MKFELEDDEIAIEMAHHHRTPVRFTKPEEEEEEEDEETAVPRAPGHRHHGSTEALMVRAE